MTDLLFVYGTLRRAAGHPMHRLLARHAERVGPARYAGRLYDLGPYPAVVPDRSAGAVVHGELYRMRQRDTLLPLLDRYEGCTEADGPGAEYRREAQPVERPDGTTAQAWVYLYNRPVAGRRLISSGDYLRR